LNYQDRAVVRFTSGMGRGEKRLGRVSNRKIWNSGNMFQNF